MTEQAGNHPLAVNGPQGLSAERRFELEAMPHLQDLTRTASRLMGDRTRAEDVVQEAYLQAWKSFSRFETGTNCRAWLYKILFHCIHHYRRKWFRLSVVKPMDEYTEATAAYTAPIPEHLTDEDFVAALDKVPSDFRAVILLVDVEEFAYRDAADILGVPIGTVMSRLNRGRKILREQLSGIAAEFGYGISMEKEADA
ncbi:MAG: sigma-70 family RNA polymerase sigma factor [Acidobacteria bacterium]|nr:sigma-70 family RNA polymerase sigma factor [Acidobacteriota bacterium]